MCIRHNARAHEQSGLSFAQNLFEQRLYKNKFVAARLIFACSARNFAFVKMVQALESLKSGNHIQREEIILKLFPFCLIIARIVFFKVTEYKWLKEQTF